MKIFVTGATGFLGKALVKALLKEGHQVKVLVRNQERLKELKSKVEVVHADLGDKADMAEAVKGVDIIFHLAAIIHEVSIPDEKYYQINVEATKMLYEACKYSGVKQFIYSSSVVVYGSMNSSTADESAHCHPENIYGETKLGGEKAIQSAFPQIKVPYTILRFSKIYGPGDTESYWVELFKLIKKKRFIMIGDGSTTMMPVYIDDAVDALIKCIKNKKGYNKTYNIAGSERITKKEFISTIAESFHVKQGSAYIPKSAIIPAAVMCELVFKILHKEPIISRKRLRFFFSSESYSIKRAKKDLRFFPKVKVAKGIQQTIDWMSKEGYL